MNVFTTYAWPDFASFESLTFEEHIVADKDTHLAKRLSDDHETLTLVTDSEMQ